jgi:hypothetical protein
MQEAVRQDAARLRHTKLGLPYQTQIPFSAPAIIRPLAKEILIPRNN